MERKIIALEMVEPDDRAAYIPTDDGGYELHPEIVAMLDDMNSRRAELDAKLEAERALRVDLVTKRDLRKALADADVAPKFHAAVAAHLREGLKLAVEERDGEYEAGVETPLGIVSLSSAVQSWLSTDSGAPFRPAPKFQQATHFTGRIRAMKAMLH